MRFLSGNYLSYNMKRNNNAVLPIFVVAEVHSFGMFTNFRGYVGARRRGSQNDDNLAGKIFGFSVGVAVYHQARKCLDSGNFRHPRLVQVSAIANGEINASFEMN